MYRLWQFFRDKVQCSSYAFFYSPGIVFPHCVSLITFVFPDTVFSPSHSLLYHSRLLISTPSLTFPCLTLLFHLYSWMSLSSFHSAALYLFPAVGQGKCKDVVLRNDNDKMHIIFYLYLRCRELISV